MPKLGDFFGKSAPMLQIVKSELDPTTSFFPREQEAHQQRVSHNSTVLFALD